MGIPLDPARKSYLESLFPNLITGKYEIKAGPAAEYNCVAWALGSTDSWYWPSAYRVWPGRERRQTVVAFTSLFQSMGYESCADGSVEVGYSKIVLYVRDGIPLHVARIDASGKWSSKLGNDELLEHDPDALTGVEYGAPLFFFRKKN